MFINLRILKLVWERVPNKTTQFVLFLIQITILYLYRSNRLPMQTLGWKSPIDIRKALPGASS